MTTKAVGKVFKQGKANTLFLSIPAKVSVDQRFPFKQGEDVMVVIQGKRVVVEKIDGGV